MDLTRPLSLRTHSISAENPTGERGMGGRARRGTHSTAYASDDLPIGWKKSPCIDLEPFEERVIANIEGMGTIQHIWMTTLPEHWRRLILKIYWDDSDIPSVQVPLGDFFCLGWCEYTMVNSLPITVAPAGGLNSYWEMPFSRGARIVIENLSAERIEGVFYQITWAETAVSEDSYRFNATWRRSDPLESLEAHCILDGVSGPGQYVGTYLAWESHHSGWWGEGPVKFYLDEDSEYPSINGTGTEDYFGGAWSFEHPARTYAAYSTPYLGMPQVIEPQGFYSNLQRFGLYRWHLKDPIVFQDGIRATVQAIGFRTAAPGRERYCSLRDDIASMAVFYAYPHNVQAPADLDVDLLDPA